MTAPQRILIGLALLFVLLCAPVYYLFYTTSGSQFFLTTLLGHFAGGGTIGKVEGRLADTLRLENIRLEVEQHPQSISRLTFSWNPGALLRGRVEVDALTLAGARIELPAADREDDESAGLPDLSALPEILIREIRIEEVELHHTPNHNPDQPPLGLQRLLLSGRLEQGSLQIVQLSLQSDRGNLEGEAEARLVEPYPLSGRLDWSAPLPDGSAAQGQLKVSGDSRRLEVRHQGAGPLPVDLEAVVEELTATPRWDFSLSWNRFELPAWLGFPGLTLEPGRLHSRGGLDAYELELSGGQSGGGLPAMQWSADARGNSEDLDLTRLAVRLLQGEIQASGRVGWSGGSDARLDFNASTLDLSAFHPDLPQRLDGRGELTARFDQGRLELERLGISLEEPGTEVVISGSLMTGRAEPELDARLSWKRLQWPLVDTAPLVSSDSGQLDLNGTPEAYQLQLEAEARTPALGTGSWQLAGSGGREQLTIEQLRGEILGGVLTLLGELGWGDVPTARLTLSGEALQPAGLVPDWPERAQLSVAGELELKDRTFRLQNLVLQIPATGSRLNFDARGELAQQPLETPLQAEISWSALSWPPTGESLVESPAGRLKLDGTPTDYKLELETGIAGPGIPRGEWRLTGQGDLGGLRLQPLHGQLLDGTLEAQGTLRWDPEPEWDLQLTGKGLDPAGQLPELNGSLGLQVSTQGTLGSDGLPKARLELTRLKGKLNGRPLQGQALLHTAAGRHRMEKFSMRAGDNRLDASGTLTPEQLDLSWDLNLKDPAALAKGAGGRLTAKGEIGGSLQEPTLQARLNGSKLAWEDLRLKRVDADLKLQLSEKAPVQLKLNAEGLKSGEEALLERLSATGKGRLNDHRLDISLKGPSGGVKTQLKGGIDLERQQWSGAFTRLAADSPKLGGWRLVKPAALLLGAEESALQPACLKGKGKLCLEFKRDQTGKSAFNANLESVPLTLLLADVGGTLSAKLDGTLGPSGALAGSAEGRITPGQLRVRAGDKISTFKHQGGSLNAVVDRNGLTAELLLQPLRRGRVEGQIKLPGVTAVPLPERQPLSGRIKAQLPDLALVQSFAPQLSEVQGRLDADVRLGGTLAQPAVQGSVKLREGAARVPAAGLHLRDISLNAAADPAQPLRMKIKGGLSSGAGRIELRGDSDVQTGATRLTLKGNRFDAVNTGDALVRIAPDLKLAWEEGVLKLRGKLGIPEARITPQIDLTAGVDDGTGAAVDPDSAIAPSPDVVVVNRESTATAAPPPLSSRQLPLDGELTITLGDAVSIDAVGFKSRLEGRVTLLHTPNQRAPLPRAKGALHIKEGTFRSFGQDLEIEWGRLLFDDVPVTEPEVNIRAVRWIRNDEQVQVAGLHLTGTPKEPNVELFSRPQLDDDSIQSYLLTGRGPDSQERVLNIGTQLRDDFYVGYGINLLEKTHEFNVRYDILRWLGLEAAVGEADKTINFSYTWEK